MLCVLWCVCLCDEIYLGANGEHIHCYVCKGRILFICPIVAGSNRAVSQAAHGFEDLVYLWPLCP